MSKMKKITVDKEKQEATAEAGNKLADLDSELGKHGFCTVAGHNPDTGIAGLTLGGGVGYLSRKYGMTIDNLVRVRLVTVTGELVTADSHSHPDLFWALRGGGGNFGVVVDFTYKIHPIPAEILGGSLVFLPIPVVLPYPPDVFREIRDYWTTAPNEVGGLIVLPFKAPLIATFVYAGPIEEGEKEFSKFKFYSPINGIKPMSYHNGVSKIGSWTKRRPTTTRELL